MAAMLLFFSVSFKSVISWTSTSSYFRRFILALLTMTAVDREKDVSHYRRVCLHEAFVSNILTDSEETFWSH